MKTIKSLVILSLVGMIALSSCKYNAGDRMPSTNSAKIDSVSYALGAWFGGTIKSANFGELNYCQMDKGLKDILNDKDLKISEQEIMNVIQSYLMERQTFVSEKGIKEGEEFLAANKEKEGVVTTESGLQYKVIQQGDGIAAVMGDTVEVNYVGKFLNGEEFDSSYTNGAPVKFPLGNVIKGWSEGIQYINEGGKIILYVPSELGYGAQPYGPIPASSTLIFEVELIKVFKAAEVKEVKK